MTAVANYPATKPLITCAWCVCPMGEGAHDHQGYDSWEGNRWLARRCGRYTWSFSLTGCAMTSGGSQSKTKGVLEGAKEALAGSDDDEDKEKPRARRSSSSRRRKSS
jgi:hypothetical protein